MVRRMTSGRSGENNDQRRWRKALENAGKEKHEGVLELAGADDKPFEANGKTSEVENVMPGQTATLEWTIDKPGQYQLACHINENNEDHFASGMVIPFTVTGS